jgi:hypothetical protein
VALFILAVFPVRLKEHCWRYVKFLAQPANMLLGQFTLAVQHFGGDAFGAEDIEQVLLPEAMRFHQMANDRDGVVRFT